MGKENYSKGPDEAELSMLSGAYPFSPIAWQGSCQGQARGARREQGTEDPPFLPDALAGKRPPPLLTPCSLLLPSFCVHAVP